jgi:hypothetical protein|tara:strand:+ start:524 stop:628 length:105 start_codon:yes stop_codon:yes gene_type:complete
MTDTEKIEAFMTKLRKEKSERIKKRQKEYKENNK